MQISCLLLRSTFCKFLPKLNLKFYIPIFVLGKLKFSLASKRLYHFLDGKVLKKLILTLGLETVKGHFGL